MYIGKIMSAHSRVIFAKLLNWLFLIKCGSYIINLIFVCTDKYNSYFGLRWKSIMPVFSKMVIIKICTQHKIKTFIKICSF